MYGQSTNKLIALATAIALLIMALPLGFACDSDGKEAPKADFAAEPTSGDAPLQVQFTDRSEGEVTDWAWDFNNDGIVDSSERSPSYTYETPGTYTVSLEVTGPGGSDREIKARYIEVTGPAPAPEAGFSAEPTSGCVPLEIQFTDESTGDISSWSWNFGDGLSSTEQNPSHTYEYAGTYTVSLTVTNLAGSDTETRSSYIAVYAAPVADFSASATSVVAAQEVEFTDESTGATAWSWDFGDGSTSTEQNPSYAYDTPGTYTVTLTVTGPGGTHAETKVDYIEVTAPSEFYTVCITQIATHPDLDSNRQGIIDAMAEEGFIEGENVEFIVRNAEFDMTVAASIADLFISLEPDLVHAITTPSAQTVVAAAEGTDIPIIFSSVSDPVTAGLVPSWEEAAPHVTGVSDSFEMPPQVEFILEVLPDIETLGIAYNPGEVNAQVQADILNEVAPDYGLTVVEATAATTADVYAAGMSLVGQCDAVWIPTCNTVGGVGIESIIQVGEDNDLPIFGSAVGMIETGLVGGCSVDYYWIGQQAGHMAARILRGESMADIPPMKSAVSTVVYPAAAERMGMTIPQAVIDGADIVIEE